MATAVARSGSRMPHVKGTKPSIRNAQLLVSTGIPSLDHILGGGLHIGSIFLIEQDTYGKYSETMLKYFMAEGVISSQDLLVASQNKNPSELLSQIPAVIESSEKSKNDDNTIPTKMEIAWRYENMKLVDSSPSGPQEFGHYYDLTKQMHNDEIEKINKVFWDGEHIKWHAKGFNNSAYIDLLKTIQNTIQEGNYHLKYDLKPKTVLRIAIHFLGSRLWLSDTEEDSHSDLLKFMYCLRVILQNSFTVATITFPTHFYNNSDCLIERLEHSVDYAIHLESFTGSSKETNPLFKDYHGLVHVKKIATFNMIKPHKPHAMDLAFKMRKKKFVIEVLHLPPELNESTSREQDDLASPASSCFSTSSRKNPLDF